GEVPSLHGSTSSVLQGGEGGGHAKCLPCRRVLATTGTVEPEERGMLRRRTDVVAEHFRRSCQTLETAASDAGLATVILDIADAITAAMRAGGKLLLAGNGGSAGDAQHIAGEFLSRLNFDRNPLPAIALTTDTSVLTAIGNDYGFDKVFERQVRGLGRKGDVLVAISTSRRSPNILAALRAAPEMELTTIGFTGQGETTLG